MAITDWPAEERPREKLLQRGAKALSDAELLAIFLRTGVKGKTAVDLARTLLNSHGSLRNLLAAGEKQFCANHGLGIAKYVQLQAVLEMGRRHLKETLLRGDILCNPADTRRYLMTQMRDYPNEVFACLFLDNQHRIMFSGKFKNLPAMILDLITVFFRMYFNTQTFGPGQHVGGLVISLLLGRINYNPVA